jgi:hypothetical protein
MASTDRTINEPGSRQVTRQRGSTELDRRRGYEPAIYSSPLSMMRRMHEEMDRVFSDLCFSRRTRHLDARRRGIRA